MSNNGKNMSKKYRIGELFAGIGGIGLGFKQAGFDISWANEIDQKASYTYSKNFDTLLINKNMEDVNPFELPDIDVLTGGFPCQAFSIAGYRKGFEDDRGNLFFDIIRYINALNPKVVFLENVKNLSSHDGGRTFKIIQEKLQESGYYIKSSVLNTCEYSSIPQNRERIYIVCFKDKEHFEHFRFPEKISFTKSIKELIDYHLDDESYYYDKSKHYDTLKGAMDDDSTVYQWRRVYVRKNKSGLCPTLTANMGTGGHNVPLILDHGRIRKLTPRECSRFQGFPEDYIFPEDLVKSALYKQIGNSVSVPVIKLIAEQILKVLEK